MQAFLLPHIQAYLRYFDLPGDGPACVYLSGLGYAATAAYPQPVSYPGLAGRRSILVDWLGTGFSDRPAEFSYTIADHAASIAALLEWLGQAGCTVIGHSMGGAAAIELASGWPALVERLVLAESNLDPGGGSFSRSIAAQPEASFVSAGFAKMMEELRQQALAGDRMSALGLGVWRTGDALGLHRTATSLVAGTRPTWRELLYALPIRRAYIFGELSLPDADTIELPRHGIPVAVVPAAGHAMMMDNPAGFARVLAGLMAE